MDSGYIAAFHMLTKVSANGQLVAKIHNPWQRSATILVNPLLIIRIRVKNRNEPVHLFYLATELRVD